MIAALMLYSIAITLLLGVAAAAAESLLRLTRRAARFAWMAAMVAALGLSLIRAQAAFAPRVAATPAPVAAHSADSPAIPPTILTSVSRSTAEVARPTALPRFEAPTISISATSSASRFDRPLLIGWLLFSAIGLSVVLVSALRLSRRRWSARNVDGVPVLVSHDVGPAVIGVLRYRIVLPAWSLELPMEQREMILAHEQEHARAGDPSLLFAATLLVAAAPWNVGLWWMARRLRYAIELDCDARVLRGRDSRLYGSLLIDVGERTLGGATPLAAMAEPVSLIERRIAAMTANLPRFAALRGLGAAVVAAGLVFAACSTPHPSPAPTPSEVASTPPRSADTTATRLALKTDELPSSSPTVTLVTVPSARALADDVALYDLLQSRMDSAAAILNAKLKNRARDWEMEARLTRESHLNGPPDNPSIVLIDGGKAAALTSTGKSLIYTEPVTISGQFGAGQAATTAAQAGGGAGFG
ncbi:MAG TPA: M56 family metallopeptidase, partial [Gemmatimonadaceae bacterium]